MSDDLPLDIETWPTKEEVAEAIGKTLTTVTRLMADGSLNPIKDERGRNRFPPAEVAILVQRVAGTTKAIARKEEFKEFELDVIRSIVGLLKDPREKIDSLFLSMIADLRTENARLLAVIASQREDVDAAKDHTSERTMALEMVKSDTRIKELALSKILEKAALIFGGGKMTAAGVMLTADQLEELIMAGGDFFTPDQLNMAKAIVTKHKSMQPKVEAPKPVEASVNVSQ